MWRVVHYIHLFLLLFVVFGWASPWHPLLVVHLALIPLMILHWKTNHDVCILSTWEQNLRKLPPDQPHEPGYFIKLLWTKSFGKLPTERNLLSVTYGISLVSWCITILRLV